MQQASPLWALTIHLPYRITQCYLPRDRSDIPSFTPAEASTRFSNPGRMQGWADMESDVTTEK